MTTTHYRIDMEGKTATYMNGNVWPDFKESMLPRIGENIRSVTGAEVTVVGIIHTLEFDNGYWTRVVILKVQ